MTNFCINYVWLILGKKIIDKAKQFKKEIEDCKDLNLLQIIKDKFDLHDFILNAKPDYLYLQNLISDSLNQNSIPHQIFLKTYTADELNYNQELGLNYPTNREAKEFFNSEILELFKENGKFQIKLNDFFKSINKKNNIKLIMLDKAQEEILSNLQKLISDENEQNKFKEDLKKMNDFYFDLKEIFERFLTKEKCFESFNKSLLNMLNTNKEFSEKKFNSLLDFKKEFLSRIDNNSITIDLLNFLKLIVRDLVNNPQNYKEKDFTIKDLFYYYFVQITLNKDKQIKITFDHNKKIATEHQRSYLIDFSKFVSVLYTNLIQEKDCLFTDFDTEKQNLNSKIYENKNYIKFSFIGDIEYFIEFKDNKKNYTLKTYKKICNLKRLFPLCHAGLFFNPKSWLNFPLFLVKSALEFSENPFSLSFNERYNGPIGDFAYVFELIMDDFFDFFAKNYKDKDFTKENYQKFEQNFKKFIKDTYQNKLIDQNKKLNGDFLQSKNLESFENHFYSGLLEKMHINNDNTKDEFMGFVTGKLGESYEKQYCEMQTEDINEFLSKYQAIYDAAFKISSAKDIAKKNKAL